jgi:hypothetical protein
MQNYRDSYISPLVIARFPEMTKEEQLITTQELWVIFDMVMLLADASSSLDKTDISANMN